MGAPNLVDKLCVDKHKENVFLLKLKSSIFFILLMLMEKLKVYVHSFEIPTVDFVDKEGAMHSCAHAQRTAFQRLGQFSSIVGNRYLPDEEKKALTLVEDFYKNNDLEFEIIDLGTLDFLARLKLKMEGLKPPSISYREKKLYNALTMEDLKELVKS